MKISAMMNNCMNVNRSQTFNGLWGRTTENSDLDPSLGIIRSQEIYYYYPYSDESREEIDKVVRDNTDSYIKGGDDDSYKYIMNTCKECYRLPFSKEDVERYMNQKNASDAYREMHYYFLGNERFHSNNPTSQKSGESKVFNKALNELL